MISGVRAIPHSRSTDQAVRGVGPAPQLRALRPEHVWLVLVKGARRRVNVGRRGRERKWEKGVVL